MSVKLNTRQVGDVTVLDVSGRVTLGEGSSAIREALRERVGADIRSVEIRLEGSATAIPTAIFFDLEEHSTHFGREAIALYLAGVDGRLMRSLKSVLGSSLMREPTEIGSRQVGFEPWQAGLDRVSYSVSSSRLSTLEVGEPAQIVTRAGALGWEWIEDVKF